MDRRASLRRPIQLAAQLQFPTSGEWPCQIADVCAEGLFIRLREDAEQALAPQQALAAGQDVKVVFCDTQSGLVHGLGVRVARHIPGALGVYFTEVNARAMSALLQLCGSDGVAPVVSLSPGPQGGMLLLRQCSRHMVSYLDPLLTSYMVTLEALLREEALKATSDQLAGECLDAAVQFRARQRPFCLQMMQALEAPVRLAGASKNQLPLALVDKSEFEEWLTLRVMITKTETRLRSSLLPFRMRLDKAGVVNDTGQHYPLGPGLICHSLQQTLLGFRLTRGVEKICLRHFERHVLSQVDTLYEELNHLLIRQGLLPHLDLSRYLLPDALVPGRPVAAREPVAPLPEPAALSPAPVAPLAESVVTAHKTMVLDQAYRADHGEAERALSTVHSLLQALSASKRAMVSASNMLPLHADKPLGTTVNAQALRNRLDRLAAPVAAGGAPLDLGLRVDQLLSGTGVRLTSQQQDDVDIVAQFFTSLRQSTHLSVITRERLLRLETTVLGAVWEDRSFFTRLDGPLRAIVNRIAELGAPAVRPVLSPQHQIDELIERLRSSTTADTGLLQSVLAELDALVERQNQVYRRNVERVVAAAEGSQKVDDARQAVYLALSARLSGKRVPRVLMTLINGGWRDLLVLTHIREGAGSPRWPQYLAVLDTLLGFAADPGSGRLIDMAELLRVIQAGLATISGHQLTAGQLRDELRRLLVSAPAADDWVQLPNSLEDDPRAELRHLNETRHRDLQHWISRAQKMQPGEWFRQRSTDGENQPVRLVWIGTEHARFVLVNHQGMKVIDSDLLQMAGQLQQGLLVPAPEFSRPMVDESIDRMMQQMYEQLTRATGHDALTGLLTRAELERSLLKWLGSGGDDGNWSLLQLDIRQFRLLNDAAGTEAGNQTLRILADLLRKRVPDEQALLSRLGGDVFLLVVPTEEAASLARQLIQDVANLALNFAGRDYRLMASVGLASSSPLLARGDQWLDAVNDACREAKRRGGGQIHAYQAAAVEWGPREQIASHLSDLTSLDGERVLLRCQKIIPLQPKAKLGAWHEVLLSLFDAQGGILPADQVVRAAESYHRIQMVDRWVVGRVLDWMQHNPVSLDRAGGLFIHVSGHSLNDAQLLEFIYETLSRQEVPLERLCFEISEASVIRNLQEVAEFMRELKELGCRFCLGNFGAASMSYAVLKTLPVDVIKLDGLFARSLSDRPADQAVVRALVEMAHFLGLEVMASQIESREILELFRQLGVDYAQGHVIGKPHLLDKL